MIIHDKRQTYRWDTGEPDGFIHQYLHERCDFTGIILEGPHVELHAYPKYRLDYENQDPGFGCGDEFEFGRKYDIDVGLFLGDSYAIQWDAELEFLELVLEKQSSFAEALREVRVATAIRLIEAGEITPDQLSGAEESDFVIGPVGDD